MKEIFNKIKNSQLPGYTAHKIMMPQGRVYKMPINGYKKSAVSIISFEYQNDIGFILLKRSSGLEYHSGQISLPGGQKDPTDSSLWDTAKRETYEETNVSLSDDYMIRPISPLYIDVSNFLVQPFITFIPFIPEIKINKQEIDDFYIVKFSDFFSDKNIKHGENERFRYPYFKLGNNQVWGATAMILEEFFMLLKEFYNFA